MSLTRPTWAILISLLWVSQVAAGQIKSVSARSVASKAAQSSHPSEEIRVHGHWTINVLNPDGSLSSHHEFENALQNGGQQTLSQLLTGFSAGHWDITLSSSGRSPCQGGTGGKFPNACTIIENTAGASAGTAQFSTLVVTQGSAAGQTGQTAVFLNGNFTAFVAGTIDRVDTSLATCPKGSHSACNISGGATPFTSASPAPVSVSVGQTVQVIVVISFS
jgi:hypothetical protein